VLSGVQDLSWTSKINLGLLALENRARKQIMSNEVKSKWWQHLSGFDIFVMLGGLVNLFVISFLLGYWLLH
jgi:divalent metal cation (Fe/Co/Zn/Cd) transporter